MSEELNQDLIDTLIPVGHSLQAYHQHQVIGIENIPQEGPALIVCNHSLATYDIVLLAIEIYNVYGRLCRQLVDRLFFKVPFVGQFVEATGGCAGSHDTARELLEAGNLVTVAPGGMREALRPSSERYQILWEHRKGFAKLAMKTGVPIILAACPKADDIFEVYPNFVTKWFYKTFKVPVFLARGLGPTPIPRPVKLVHFLSEPIHPPKMSQHKGAQTRQLNAYHDKLQKRMRELIGEAIAYRGD